MAGGGTITIVTENIQEAGEEAGYSKGFVRLSVADSGTGMTPDVMARAFEPFFTTKDVSKGSGLGLPQVYGFAQQSGGRVTITSDVGAGTVVTIMLPRSLNAPVADDEGDEAPAPKPDGQRRGHLLLVEDDIEVSSLAREMFSSLGFAVIHVSSAEAALGALANDREIDVVFSDVMMPGGVNGLQLAREVRSRYPHTPVILTTGYAEAATGVKDGEFTVLLKPFTLEALADALGIDVT
jgi:CheY-like chemotaxis protein